MAANRRTPVLLVAGVSHATAPLAIREAVAVAKDDLAAATLRLRATLDLEECVILSTCNRVEIHAVGAPGGSAALLAFLGESRGRSVEDLRPHAFCLEGEDAVRHLFRVAASLDSMVVGEAQILGQVKDAYRTADEAGTLGPTLTALRDRSFAAAKRARAETAIGRNAVSVSHVAVELAQKIFGNLEGRSTLLIGSGKMSELAARRLVQGGAAATVLGRTLARAEDLAKSLGGRAASMDQLRSELARADVVVSGTGCPELVVRRQDVEAALVGRHRPLFIIDIAVPRDVDPEVRGLAGVFLYDLDDLRSVTAANLAERQREAAGAEAIVEAEVTEFLAWRKSLDVVPLLVELRRRGEEISRSEVEKVLPRMGDLSPAQVKAVEAVAQAIVNKLLHAPTVQLKELARSGDGRGVAMVSSLLDLTPARDGIAAGTHPDSGLALGLGEMARSL